MDISSMQLAQIDNNYLLSNKFDDDSLDKQSSYKVDKIDDIPEYYISEKVRTKSISLYQEINSANSLASSMQLATNFISKQSAILNSIKEKLVEINSNNPLNSAKSGISNEIDDLLNQLNIITKETNKKENFPIELEFITSEEFNKEESLENKAIINKVLKQFDENYFSINYDKKELEFTVRKQFFHINKGRGIDFEKESLTFNKEKLLSKEGSYSLSQANNLKNNISQLLV